ncbi:MAG: glucose sorbosone dehydrogenase [Patescibacteria group bacterium]|nr:MAG: glucose sorbosone dehydrogenase [Patescibacteria group bacterium]
MKKRFLIILVFFFILGFLAYFRFASKDNISPLPKFNNPPSPAEVGNLQIAVIASDLDTPWAIAFLPDGNMITTERKGSVRLIDKKDGLLENPIFVFDDVVEKGEGGLLGVAVHPNFGANGFVYFYYTYKSSSNVFNKVVRMVFKDNSLIFDKVIVNDIPASQNHNGGRIKFGPDGYLYITTGDAEKPSLAQDKNSLAGKILKVDDDGNPATGNPFDNLVYSYGHRNPQGITWDENGTLWATEHGPSGLETGNDEINKIEPGKNYGWPEIRGAETKDGMVSPILESGKGNTWAPSGIAYFEGKLYFGGLRGEALYRVVFVDEKPKLETLFKGEFGRIRDVVLGPDNMLYITTSNKDGRGRPGEKDDKIIRINPRDL